MGHASLPSVRAAAHAYLGRGWSVIPIEHRSKRPLIAWLELQSRVATANEADTWLQRWPDANIGIVTGRISGLAALDVDAVHGSAESLAQLEIEHGPLPHWLLRTLGAKRTGHPLPYWRNLVRAGVEEGERNARLASLAGHLLRHEVDPEVVLELLLAWNRVRCRPPLDDAEVAGVLDSITRLHLAERGAAR